MNEFRSVKPSCRNFLGTAASGASLLLPASLVSAAQEKKDDEDVSTNEDLMREHGILKRVLIACDEKTFRKLLFSLILALGVYMLMHSATASGGR